MLEPVQNHRARLGLNISKYLAVVAEDLCNLHRLAAPEHSYSRVLVSPAPVQMP